jgi:hypothetical protein
MVQAPPLRPKPIPPPGTQYQIHLVTEKEMNSSEFKRMQKYFKELWDFLRKHGKEPYEYKWSGYTLYDLLGWLRDVKNINLMENKFTTETDEALEWFIFDESTKKKYLDKLNPANFKAEDVIYSYEHLREQHQDAALKQIAAKLSKEEMKAYVAKMQTYDEGTSQYDAAHGITKASERSDQTKAMMDGIDILHKYLQLVAGQSIVILNIG